MIASRRTAPTSRPVPDDGRALVALVVATLTWRRRIEKAVHATAFWRVAAVVVCVVAAYNYSLQTLVQEMGQQTPLAYLGLVPLIALLLAVVLAQRRTGAPISTIATSTTSSASPCSRWRWGCSSSRHTDCRASTGSTGLTCSRCRSSSPPRYRSRSVCAPWFGFAPRCSSCFWHGHIPTWSSSTTSSSGSPTRPLRRSRWSCKSFRWRRWRPNGDFLVSHATGVSQSFTVSVELRLLRDQQRPRFPDRRRRCRHPDARPSCLKMLWLASGTAFLFVVNVGRILLVLCGGRALGRALRHRHPASADRPGDDPRGDAGHAALAAALPPEPRSGRSRRESDAEPKPRRARTLAVRGRGYLCRCLRSRALSPCLRTRACHASSCSPSASVRLRLSPSSVASAPVSGWTLSEEATYSWAPRYFGAGGTLDALRIHRDLGLDRTRRRRRRSPST